MSTKTQEPRTSEGGVLDGIHKIINTLRIAAIDHEEKEAVLYGRIDELAQAAIDYVRSRASVHK